MALYHFMNYKKAGFTHSRVLLDKFSKQRIQPSWHVLAPRRKERFTGLTIP